MLARMSFGTFVVIVAAGLMGPLLPAAGLRFVPVAVGETLAGVLVGPAVLGSVDPANATISTLGDIGFAMLMLTVGMHLPLRDRRLAAAAPAGAALAVIVCVLAVPAGLLAAAVAGGGHAAVYAVVLASGSAAVLLPALQELRLQSVAAVTAMAQVTLADVVTIVSVPIVLQPSRTGHAILGAVLVAACAAGVLALSRGVARERWVHRVRALSKSRHWALDLRLALLMLFLLAWIAQQGGTSFLIAGFGAGVTVALLGGPKRLSTQVRGIGEGFFVPLYFVVLGAKLDVSGLAQRASMIWLALLLVALNVLIHVLASGALRRPPAGALAASAQLGVPAAVASLGLSLHAISAVTATAIVLAALASLLVCTAGIELLARQAPRAAESTV
jgi:Kef-type K+ transport system membrane component KefB